MRRRLFKRYRAVVRNLFPGNSSSWIGAPIQRKRRTLYKRADIFDERFSPPGDPRRFLLRDDIAFFVSSSLADQRLGTRSSCSCNSETIMADEIVTFHVGGRCPALINRPLCVYSATSLAASNPRCGGNNSAVAKSDTIPSCTTRSRRRTKWRTYGEYIGERVGKLTPTVSDRLLKRRPATLM